jgi:predicted anti-sigma-YlaC factor YlaD
MTCEELRTFLDTTLPAERTPQQIAAAREHARECPDCSGYLSQTLELEEQLSALPPIPAGAAVEQAVMSRILRKRGSRAGVASESRAELTWSVLLGLGLLLSVLPYLAELSNGKWFKHPWAFRLQLGRQLGYSAFMQPWPTVVLGALAAGLTATVILWQDSRA